MENDVKVFNVVNREGTESWKTVVSHHVDKEYEMFCITQELQGSIGETITVILHREQLAELAAIAKGH